MLGFRTRDIWHSGFETQRAASGQQEFQFQSATRRANCNFKGEGRSGKTNPINLTCFLSVTCLTMKRNKPKRDMSKGVSSLERN